MITGSKVIAATALLFCFAYANSTIISYIHRANISRSLLQWFLNPLYSHTIYVFNLTTKSRRSVMKFDAIPKIADGIKLKKKQKQIEFDLLHFIYFLQKYTRCLNNKSIDI